MDWQFNKKNKGAEYIVLKNFKQNCQYKIENH